MGRRHLSAAGALLAVVGLVAGCSTQRWPGPMEPTVVPLPPGDMIERPAGLEDIEVIRHADPVRLRRAGARAAFPMRFWNKKERARSGAWVLTDSGGRAEMLWPRDGTSVVLFERGAAQLGERERGEPAVRLRGISRVKLNIGPDVLVELEGGALLSGDPEELSGPFVIERLPIGDILRIYNRASHSARVEYRDAILTVGPGQVIDVPVLEVGSRPYRLSALGQEIELDGRRVRSEGPVELVEVPPGDGVLLSASSRASVSAQGLEVQLDAGDRVRFGGLGMRPGLATPASETSTPVPSAGDETPDVEGAPVDGAVIGVEGGDRAASETPTLIDAPIDAPVDPPATDPQSTDPQATGEPTVDPAAAVEPGNGGVPSETPTDPPGGDPAVAPTTGDAPLGTDPAPADPNNDPPALDPTAGDPTAGDPAAGDPAAVDPAAVDPAAADPAGTEVPATEEPPAGGATTDDPAGNLPGSTPPVGGSAGGDDPAQGGPSPATQTDPTVEPQPPVADDPEASSSGGPTPTEPTDPATGGNDTNPS